MLSFIIATVFIGVLAIFALVILYISMSYTHKQNIQKLNEVVDKSNKVTLSNYAGDKKTTDNLHDIKNNMTTVYGEVNTLWTKSLDLNKGIDDLDKSMAQYKKYANTTTDEYNKQISSLPFDSQRKEIDRIEKVVQENDTSISNIRFSNAGQNVTLGTLERDLKTKNTDYQGIDNVLRKVSSDYVKSADTTQYLTRFDFEKNFKEGTLRAIKELGITLNRITSKYASNLEFDIVKKDIEAALKILTKLDDRIKFINDNYASKKDLSQILTSNGALATELDKVQADVITLTDLVQAIPSRYVNQADAISVLQNASILNYAMIQFINANTININGSFAIGTPSPQTRFHINDNTSQWSARIQNRNVNTYIGHADGFGMMVQTDNRDPNKYALQVNNGSSVIMQTNNDGNTTFGNTAQANVINARDRICIGAACIDQSDLRKIQYLQYL
jgi:hypothetical protein